MKTPPSISPVSERGEGRTLPAFEQPTAADMARAAAIVGSHPVISAYASCEWDELHEDGQAWIAAIVREASQPDERSISDGQIDAAIARGFGPNFTAAADRWRSAIHEVTHDVLPLVGDKVRDVRGRAAMQVQIADRVIARLLARDEALIGERLVRLEGALEQCIETLLGEWMVYMACHCLLDIDGNPDPATLDENAKPYVAKISAALDGARRALADGDAA